MNIDFIIICTASLSIAFFVFLFIYRIKTATALTLLPMIKEVFLISIGFNIIGDIFACFIFKSELFFSDYFYIIFFSSIILSVFAFVYVLCVFGPNETSIRVRLIELLGRSQTGLSREEIKVVYNNQLMLDVRLKRLLGVGDIIKHGDSYALLNRRNAFFQIDSIAVFLRRLYRMEQST